jgi:hypothetical protein
MATEWNLFVKKIYHEGKSKNSKYQFKQALKDASRRKSEMKHSASSSKNKTKRHTKHGGTRRKRKHQ